MTVLVTGGAGYIGSHTVRALRERGREVVVLDNLGNGHEAAVLGAPLVVGDIDDGILVEKLVAEYGVDSCIHFAALKAVGESMEQPARYFHNNVAGSNTLLDALQRSGVTKVVFSSSAAVYGTPTVNPIVEDTPLHPESVYGETKWQVERMLSWFDATLGVRSVSLRYFNAAGAATDGRIGEDLSITQNLVPVLMKALLGRSPALQLFGDDYPTPDGTAIRDYVHVEDLADAHVLAVDYLDRGGETTAINLGTGVGSSVREVLDAAQRISGREVPYVVCPRRAGDPVALTADNQRAAELLGWRPQRSLDAVIASAWQWHSTHPDGFGSR
jgi:UDP-glucose-4-epimerase GalE